MIWGHFKDILEWLLSFGNIQALPILFLYSKIMSNVYVTSTNKFHI